MHLTSKDSMLLERYRPEIGHKQPCSQPLTHLLQACVPHLRSKLSSSSQQQLDLQRMGETTELGIDEIKAFPSCLPPGSLDCSAGVCACDS